MLAQAKFTFNRTRNQTMRKSQFEIVLEYNLITPIELVPQLSKLTYSVDGRSEEIQQLHHK